MKPGPLSGGRAPRAWLRRTARAVAPIHGLRRASAWLGELAGVRPRLREEPLFGRSLAGLAGRESPPAGQPAAPRPGRARSGSPGGGEPRGPRPEESPRPARRPGKAFPRPSAAAPGASPSGVPSSGTSSPDVPSPAVEAGESPVPTAPARRAPEPLHLDPRAGRDLLARHAGPVPVLSGATPPQAPLRPAATPLPAAPAPRTGREWLRDLARRGARALRRDLSRAAGERAPRESPATGRTPGSSVSVPAAEPWSTPLQGERAPADLLRQWAVPSRGPAAPSQAARSPEPPRTPRPSIPIPVPAGEAPALPPAAPTPPLPGPAGAVAIPTADDGGLSLSGLLDAALPPLLPSRDFVPPSPWKAPAQAPAAVGRPEAEAAEEDLGRLAANLKRILDEDARRHGIDV